MVLRLKYQPHGLSEYINILLSYYVRIMHERKNAVTDYTEIKINLQHKMIKFHYVQKQKIVK